MTDEVAEHLVDRIEVALLVPCLHRLGHAAHCEVLLQLLGQLVGEQIGYRCRLVDCAAKLVEIGRAGCAQELRERRRAHVAKHHLAHGEGLPLAGERHPEQRARACHVELGRVLAKVFQRAERRRAVLDLVEDHERGSRLDANSTSERQAVDDAVRVVRDLEELRVLAGRIDA